MKRKKPLQNSKKKKKTRKKRSPYKIMKEKAWKVFSIYIKMKDADLMGDGMVTCCTCGQRLHWADKKMQAGHFLDGRSNSILFAEKCVHPQCSSCNVFKNGNKVEYYEFMLETYGKATIASLRKLKLQTVKFTLEDLTEIKEKYEEKIRGLLYE